MDALQGEGQAGDIVKLQHFEVLDADGNVYTANLRKAQQRITYICRGEGEEQYEPHFTFQGFRYVKVEACPGEVRMEDFTGKVIHSAMELTGQFECSDPLINQLQHNIVWGQKGNFVDVPTDCPQRDERLGWTGDAQVFIRTASFNMNVAPFFTKWMRDLAADQLPDGGVPFVIPQVENNIPMHSATGWGDAAVICPWTIYMCYGDGRILEEQYPSMKAWINYIRSQGDNEYLWNTGFHFGDWLALDAKDGSYLGATSNDFVATAFYAYSTSLLVKAAEVLHKPEDAAHYRELHNHILKHFRQEFVTPNGRLSEATQTAYILSLAFDLLEESDRPRAARTLAQYLEVQTFPPKPEKEYALRTGFLGTPYLCHALSQNGYHDIACKLVLRTEYPSWLYPVNKGATTIWEHWDGLKEDDTFWSADMNSFNHYAYGAIGDWLYQVLAGLELDAEQPGYRRVKIAPQPGEGFTYARASLETQLGEVASGWQLSEDGKRMSCSVVIPPNATGSVQLPAASLQAVTENGLPLQNAEGILRSEQQDDSVWLEVGSGRYEFTYDWDEAN